MNIIKKIICVLFKKCCFCGKSLKWNDKVIINTKDKKTAHSDCLERHAKTFSGDYHPNLPSEEFEFYGINLML